MKSIHILSFMSCLPAVPLPAAEITFENLATPPALDSVTGLKFTTAPEDGSFYAGVVWDERVRVAGSQYKIAGDAPFFGRPHSGDYFITNESTDGGNGITLGTTMLLSGAWFGRNEYYGFGGGADSVTLSALSGDTVLNSVTFSLPETLPGQPEPLSFVDTSAFMGLSGVTGYRIDHTAPNEFSHSWIADDFQFAAPVPEPGVPAMLTGALKLGLSAARRRGNPA